jgi:hypothetical protein
MNEFAAQRSARQTATRVPVSGAIKRSPPPGLASFPAMEQPAHIKVSGALEGEFIITEERNANEFVITRDTSWKAMLGKNEREATEEEIAALEAEHGPFLPADGEG